LKRFLSLLQDTLLLLQPLPLIHCGFWLRGKYSDFLLRKVDDKLGREDVLEPVDYMTLNNLGSDIVYKGLQRNLYRYQ
jgi:hypothetical protein